MSFPASPTNGQTTTLNGITYAYSASTNSWVRTPAPTYTGTVLTVLSTTSSISTTTGAVVVAGDVIIAGTVNVNTVVAPGVPKSTTTSTPPPAPSIGDIWYYTGSDLVFRYTNDGVNSVWVDITGPERR